jgi:Apea-like HEPN
VQLGAQFARKRRQRGRASSPTAPTVCRSSSVRGQSIRASLVDVGSPSDPLKDLLAEFARVVHPLRLENASGDPRQKIPLLIFGYAQFPKWEELGRQVAGDAALSQLFPPSGSTKDRFVYRSVGGIAPVNPANVAGAVCEAAWLTWQRTSNVAPTADEFVAEVGETLDRLRRAAIGEAVTMPVRVGLAGAKMPPGRSEIVLPWCRIRPTDERDALPMGMGNLQNAGEVQTTDASGNTVSISYSGDLVAELDLPYVIRTADRYFGAQQTEQDPWPAQLDASADERRAVIKPIECIRAAFTLAEIVTNGSLVSTWRCEVDPLEGFGYGLSMSDSRRSRIFPHQMSEDEVARWTEWMERVWKFYDHVPIAIRRLLRAVSEIKPQPEDTLIDAVVVWENVFGTPQEATMRITFSMARILAQTPEDRRDRWNEFKKIYTLRSDLVHGNEKVEKLAPAQLYDAANRAVPISGALLRTLMLSHPNLLTDYKNGGDRSAAVLLS